MCLLFLIQSDDMVAYTNSLVKVNDCCTCSIMMNVFMIILGVEKNNDDAKRHYFSGNSARDILTEATELSTLSESL